MNCKNCFDELKVDSQFCGNCGGKIVLDRISFKQLLLEVFINAVGFDSKFFITLKEMVRKPDVVISDYLNGVRKRYMNPFAFLAVGAALSLIIFNYYADDFIAINSAVNAEQINEYKKMASIEIPDNLSEKETKKLESQKNIAQIQVKYTEGMMQFMLRYYNLMAFAFLLIYATLSKWTFLKPHNFGEHIIINAYIYGLTNYLSIVLFLIAVIVHPSIYMFSMLGYMLYYMFCFGKFYNLSLGKNILKLLRFLVGLLIIGLVLGFIGIIIAVVITVSNLS
jgi:hypothetical protein